MYDISANYIYAFVITSQFVLYYVVSGVMKNYLITDAKGSDERKYNCICSIIFKDVGFHLILCAVFYGFYLTAVGFRFNHNKKNVYSISTFCYSI